MSDDLYSYDVLVIGAGAAGLFAALQAKKAYPHARVLILEKTAVALAKVRISGGGRCNVTHACFDPGALVLNYPRGSQELISPFHRFQPLDTIEWFLQCGVELKVEADGRCFPVTDTSSTIVDCLLGEAFKRGVEIRYKEKICSIERSELFTIFSEKGKKYTCRSLILATGSSKEGYQYAQHLGHSLIPPVPSLFTFTIPSFSLEELSGIAIDPVSVHIEGTTFTQKGPLLLTHFGMSGPAILKLSAFAARYLHEKEYCFSFSINWLPSLSQDAIFQKMVEQKKEHPEKHVMNENPFFLPKSFWKKCVDLVSIPERKKMKECSHKEFLLLSEKLHKDCYLASGKTTHKEEFVTCGGVPLSEVHFKTMESKKCSSLFFAGEILDIDGITGGFNFQNAWTTGFLAGSACLKSV